MSSLYIFTVQQLPLSVLENCSAAQRALDPLRVAHIQKTFDPGKMREVAVSYRDGRRFIVDGQHGVAAAKDFYGAQASQIRIPCRVYENLSLAQEAELFLALNDQKAVSALDKYRVGVTKGAGLAYDVEQVVVALGLRVGANGGNINAVASLQSIYKSRGAEALTRILKVATGGFPDNKDTARFAGEILQGIGMVLFRKNHPVADKDLVHSLNKTSANKIKHDARLLPTKNSNRNVADTIVGAYNYQRARTSHLPRFAD